MTTTTTTKTEPPKLSASAWRQRLQWIANPVSYMETAVQEHPDIFAAEVIPSGGSLVYVNHPQGIQQILTNERQKLLASGKVNKILKPLLGEYSIVMLEGDRHKRERKLLLPPFHGERMQAYGKLICDLTDKVFSQLSPDQPFIARTAAQEISLQVILQAVYGLSEGERYQQLKRLLASMSDIFRSPLTSSFLFFSWLQQDWGTWSPWGHFLHQQQQINRLLYAEIEERRQQGYSDTRSVMPEAYRQDILSLLMSARDEAGQPMSDRELRDELMTLMFAGHETTATAIAWALYWIHYLPEVRQKLLTELANLEDTTNPLAIAKLPYLTAVCQETLRIYPVGMLTFPRVVQEPIEILGYQLKPETGVVGCIYLVHQREDIYPQAKQFKPERFLEKQFSPYEFIPFGGGARRCIGEALAQFEMKLVLATILTRYQLALANQSPEIPQRRGVALAPASGVKMMIQT